MWCSLCECCCRVLLCAELRLIVSELLLRLLSSTMAEVGRQSGETACHVVSVVCVL